MVEQVPRAQKIDSSNPSNNKKNYGPLKWIFGKFGEIKMTNFREETIKNLNDLFKEAIKIHDLEPS